MEQTIRAVVLRRREQGESDRRLTLLSVELGKVDAMARGAKKATSRLAAVSEPLTVGRFTVAVSKRNRYVTQVQPESAFPRLRTDYHRLTFAVSLTELYAGLLPWEHPAPEEFQLLFQSLQHLNDSENPLTVYVWAACRLLAISGFQPNFEACEVWSLPDGSRRCWLSPSQGGSISSESFVPADRFQASYEAVIAIDRMFELETPPKNLKPAIECLELLFPFWKNIIDAPIPATELARSEAKGTEGLILPKRV